MPVTTTNCLQQVFKTASKNIYNEQYTESLCIQLSALKSCTQTRHINNAVQ